jgi:hypothetical protein
MKHQPFSDHTLCLLNAAVWFVERGGYKQRPDWKIIPENRERKVIDSSVENKRATAGAVNALDDHNHIGTMEVLRG